MVHRERDATREDGCPPRLLVADDDSGFRRAVSFLLAGSGFKVTEARDGREAALALDASERDGLPFEILLLDLRMDGATGWEILRHSRESVAPGGAIPRVLLVTGFAAEADRARARREGASGLLIKPIPCEILLAEIERLGRIPRDIPAMRDLGAHLTTTG